MSEENNNQNAGGDLNDAGSADRKDVVSYETHKRLLDQLKKSTSKLSELESQVNSFIAEKQRQEEAKMQESGQFKQLIEARDARIKQLQDELEAKATRAKELEDRFVNAKKISSFKSKLPGQLVKDDLLFHANLDDIVVSENGEVDEVSLSNAVKQFVDGWGTIAFKPNAKMPNEAQRAGHPLTYEQEIRTAKSQKEFDAIRAKHGRLE